MEETFKETRKRLRIDDKSSESPKARSRKDKKAALSPRDPNVPTKPSSSMKKTKNNVPPPIVENVSEEVATENINPITATTESEPAVVISTTDVFQPEIDAVKKLVEQKSYKDLRKELKVT